MAPGAFYFPSPHELDVPRVFDLTRWGCSAGVVLHLGLEYARPRHGSRLSSACRREIFSIHRRRRHLATRYSRDCRREPRGRSDVGKSGSRSRLPPNLFRFIGVRSRFGGDHCDCEAYRPDGFTCRPVEDYRCGRAPIAFGALSKV